MTNVKENGKQITPTSWNFAIFMAKQGRKVFPIQKHDKKPLIKGWQEHATGDEATIRAWSLQHPDSNYGVVTGEGFFVIDIDVDDPAGIETEIDKLRGELGSFELGTVVKTGQGCQLYCASNGVTIRSSTKRLTDRVDIKGEGGYVVGVGSTHPNGRRYEFNDPLTLEKGIVLTRLPNLALKYIAFLSGSTQDREGATKKEHRGENTDDNRRGAIDSDKLIPKGQRNDTLFRIGCHRRQVFGLNEDDIYAILVAKNKCCDPGLGLDELRAIAQSCTTYSPGTPQHVTTEVAKTGEFTDAVIELFQDNR
ncbi:MAG: bifunctional DNA primase/polymerase, partial [Halobacteriota archaeon]